MTYVMQPYDDALEEILRDGTLTENRTGTKTLMIPGLQKRYEISDKLPILTKRRIWPTSVWAEMLCLIHGVTDNKKMVEMGCRFWTPWVDKDFESKHGYKEGDFGPIYGFQLRHFGATYPSKSGGFDQLQYMIDLIKNEPTSRRILFSLWNPCDLHQMRLPPCHFTFQLLIDGNNTMHGILTQRSNDFPIGVPANIQFYSTLTILFAKTYGFEVGTFVHNANDAHIYVDQIPMVEEYLSRSKIDSPTLSLNIRNEILEYKLDDFLIDNYNPMPKIDIPVSI